ncbi:hypothetical protein NX059_010480 [Plenodomus lindquistii]|nr:hypothetical protein NX059_010480 [Plenodomus lindquistii]
MALDCYCALCAGPLDIGYIRFGSAQGKHLRERRERVELERKIKTGEFEETREATGGPIPGNNNKVQETDSDEEMEDVCSDEEDKAPKGSGSKAGNNGEYDVDVAARDLEEEEQQWEDEDDDFYSEFEGSDYVPSSPFSAPDSVTDIPEDDTLAMMMDIQDVPLRPKTPDPVDFDARSATWSDDSDISVPIQWQPYPVDGAKSWPEDITFDPTILSVEDVAWIDRCRCLAINTSASLDPASHNGSKDGRAFISGRGQYDDFGHFNVRKLGRDKYDNRAVCHIAYTDWGNEDESQRGAFPFHEECWRILERCLEAKTGMQPWSGETGHKTKVDKDVMYSVMQNFGESHTCLDLDYRNYNAHEQFWDCKPGEEYLVCDPGPRVGIRDVLQNELPPRLLSRQSPPLDLKHKIRRDPFENLPYDILLETFKHLTIQEILTLMKASWLVKFNTDDAGFWQLLIRDRILPWFWELRIPLINATFPDGFDHKGLFLWLDAITEPRFAMKGPYMGIANRRRIWYAVQDLVPLYETRMKPIEHMKTAEDEAEAKAILASAVNLHMPMVMYPQPKEAQAVTTQFVRSWADITHHPCDFDTFWDHKERLVGIAVQFGGDLRVFGSTQGKKGTPLHIEAHNWITQIKIYTEEIDISSTWQYDAGQQSKDDFRSSRDACVRGLRIESMYSTSKQINGSANVRNLTVLPNMHLIGLQGEIAPNGMISRLGLLQAPHPSSSPQSQPPLYDPTDLLLWSCRSPRYPNGQYPRKPIDSDIHLFPYPETALPPTNLTASDMRPFETLRWADPIGRYKHLKKIRCIIVKGDVICFHPEFDGHGGHSPIGERGPVAAMSPELNNFTALIERVKASYTELKPFDKAFTEEFEIDGKGGEVVSEVHARKDGRAVRLITSSGRSVCWGGLGEEDQEWDVKKAPEGKAVVGLSVCFGKLGGWSEKSKKWSHWGMSWFGIVLGKMEV